MLGLTAPFWLAALAAIPLVRWLHRWRAPLRSAPVSAAFLWASAEDVSAGGQRRDKPDPAWRRRALIVALLAISLAGPWWQQDATRITVWVDDSLSMSTIEAGETRLEAGLAELAGALGEMPPVEASLRSLSRPARAWSSSDPRAFDADTWLAGGFARLLPPAVATLDRESAHWLVTDGADGGLRRWAERAPLERVISVGAATENVAVTQLAVRRSLQDTEDFDVLVAVSNTGTADASRSLILAAGSGESKALELTLAGGETRYLTARHAGVEVALSASLRPGDATGGDDSLVLTAPALAQAPVALDPACPAPLRQSIRAHAGLRVVAAVQTAELQILCSQRSAAAGALLRFYGAAPMPVDEAPRWQPGIGRLEEINLAPGWVANSTWGSGPAAGHEIILAAAGEPLIVVREGTPFTIESTLDMSRSEFADQPEYPVLVAGLVDLALGRTLLDPFITSARDAEASIIAPSRLQTTRSLGTMYGTARQPLADIVLALAALVLLADLLLIWRASRAARHG